MAFMMSAVFVVPLQFMPVHAQTADVADNTGPSFLAEESTVPEDTTLPDEVDEPAGTSGEATLLSGTSFNARIKQIAGSVDANFSTVDTSISEIVWSDASSIPEGVMQNSNLVSTSSSDSPVYAWFEDGIMHIASGAETIYLNEQANFMFYRLGSLETFAFPDNIDSSSTESMIEMFGDCNSLASIDLSAMDITADHLDSMFEGDSALKEITFGRGWSFPTATSIPKTNWKSSSSGAVWSYAALETMYSSGDAATFTATDEKATVVPDETLYEGDGLGSNNMHPVGAADEPSAWFTGYCINDENQDPYGYYRRVEIPVGTVIGSEWFHTDDFGSSPIGDDMREALITLLVEGTKALENGEMDFTALQKDIWHFTNHYSDSSWNGSFWDDKNYHDIENHPFLTLYIYESLQGTQNVISIEGVDVMEPVEVKINKVDGAGELLSGAGISIKGEVYTDKAGEIVVYGPVSYMSEDLAQETLTFYPGTYVISETDVPEGYKKAEDITFTVGIDGSVTCDSLKDDVIIMVDEEYVLTDVTISKQNIAGEEIAGARLTVKDSEGKTIDTWVSVEGESHIITGLEEGEYVLAEITAPEGYERAEEIKFAITADGKVTVDGENVHSVIMTDEYTPASVKISKQDIAGEEIAGAELTVTDEDGKTIDSWTSVEGESHLIEGLLPGVYTLTEKMAPEGFEVAESIIFEVLPGGIVQVDGKDVSTVTMIDDYTPYPVTIRKVEKTKSVETLITGAKLTLQDANGKAVVSWTTDGTQKKVSLVPGTYTLVETEAPEGYDVADPIIFTVAVGGTVTLKGSSTALSEAVITMVDPVADGTKTVKILKTGLDDKPLAGASLRVYHKENGKNSIDKQWTSTDSEYTLKLIPGDYVLEELSAPDGYLVAEDIKFTVQSDGRVVVDSTYVNVVTMKDEATVVGFEKVDSETGERLSGAKLQIMTKSGTVVEEWSSSSHVHHIKGKLAAGKEYILHEASAPEGYKVAEDVTFTVNKNSSELLVKMEDEAEEVVEKEYSTIQVFKTVEGTGADTAKKFGFIIALMDDEGNPFTGSLNYEMSDGNAGTLSFNSNGRAGFELSHGQHIIFKRVETGLHYTVTELDYSHEGYSSSVRDNAAEINKGENIIHFINTYGTKSSSTTSAGNGNVDGGTATSTVSGVVTSSRDTGDASFLWTWVSIIGAVLVSGALLAFNIKRKGH